MAFTSITRLWKSLKTYKKQNWKFSKLNLLHTIFFSPFFPKNLSGKFFFLYLFPKAKSSQNKKIYHNFQTYIPSHFRDTDIWIWKTFFYFIVDLNFYLAPGLGDLGKRLMLECVEKTVQTRIFNLKKWWVWFVKKNSPSRLSSGRPSLISTQCCKNVYDFVKCNS